MRERFLKLIQNLTLKARRHSRLWLGVLAWAICFVFVHQKSWNQVSKEKLLSDFASSTNRALNEFEGRIQLWSNHSQQLAQLTMTKPPSDAKSDLLNWAKLFESHKEWIATHIVTRRQGFEPSVAGTLISTRTNSMLSKDDEYTSIPWNYEIQANALQLISGLKGNQLRGLSFVRSLQENTKWIQFALRTNSPDGWSTWIVHTFSEEMFPNLQAENPEAEVYLLSQDKKKLLTSEGFSKLKIDESEISSFLNSRTTHLGAIETKFALNHKDIWIAWNKQENKPFVLLQALPNQRIPEITINSSPSLLQGLLLAVFWLSVIGVILHLCYGNKIWSALLHEKNLKKPTISNSESDSNQNDSVFSEIDSDREFCKHLLQDVGSAGEIKLSSEAIAVIKATPAPLYKGSWWIIKNLDSDRIFIAIGDASGSGLAAGASAYTIRHVLEKSLMDKRFLEDSEKAVRRAYNMASLSAEGMLLGNTHSSVFVAILELDQQRMVFINAGYPSPMLKLSERKSMLLTPQIDPVGLTTDSQPLPRWSNLTRECMLTFCNIGSRNVDLLELEDSEMLKIFIYPYGNVTSFEETTIGQDAA